MRKSIFRSTLLVAAVVLLASLTLVMGCLYNYFDGLQLEQLRDELSLAATATEQQGLNFLQNLESDRFRITWIAQDGTVLYDTRADESTMENHADREEFIEALRSGEGTSARHSVTLTERTLYAAKILTDGTVLRISVSHSTLTMLLSGILYPVLLVAILAIFLSALLARRNARRIVQPLNRLDLEHPLQNDVYEEIRPLLQRINQQHTEISSHLRQLQRKTDEITQITDNMNEGLVLLGKDRRVLSINPAAERLFAGEELCVGQDFLTLDGSSEIRTALDTAFGYGSCEIRTTRDGRDYQFNFSRIQSGGRIFGTVVLVFDVTEQMNAERTRREFSANVSHELKTPLQSIIGSAELLESGLVQPQDTPRFLSNIRKEATRLVSLIEDIIRLSQLDEGTQLPREQVQLRQIAEEVTGVLQNAAQAQDVRLGVSGDAGNFTGVRRLLFEIIYNLCDNAIKYNVPGGTVDIGIRETADHVMLSVRDTGIGVPAEHHARIFERFYRVDKSHSRKSGGTGLGLSIVKHAALYHNAALDFRSVPGEGTTVTITFPKA